MAVSPLPSIVTVTPGSGARAGLALTVTMTVAVRESPRTPAKSPAAVGSNGPTCSVVQSGGLPALIEKGSEGMSIEKTPLASVATPTAEPRTRTSADTNTVSSPPDVDNPTTCPITLPFGTGWSVTV